MADDLITATEAAQILGLADGATARRTLTRRSIMPVGRAPGRGGESLYRRDSVEHERDYPPLRGKVPAEIADLTRRVLRDAPVAEGATWRESYTLADGVHIAVTWSPMEDVAVAAECEFAPRGHRTWRLSRDPDELAAHLGPLVRAARTDLAKTQERQRDLAQQRADHLARVRAARAEVERIKAMPTGQRTGLAEALPALRSTVAQARDAGAEFGGLLPADEIAEAAGYTVDQVERAH
jgi:hypothetical protein